MIQLIINSNLLREIDDRALINRYARFCYENEESVTDDVLIQQNLTKLLDWDENGESGIPIYCSKFESIKRKDWPRLIQFIKDNSEEIRYISYRHVKRKKLESVKEVLDAIELKEKHNEERFSDPDYKVSGRGKKAKICEYNGKIYKSRQECIYKEGITKNQLYQYLKKTGQV